MKLCVAIPVGGLVPIQFAMSLARLACLPFPVKLIHFSGGTITMARNELTAGFLASDCTDLLFIDSDIEFTVADVERIISHDVDVVGGCYCERTTGMTRIVSCSAGPPDERGLAPVDWIGAGFLRVRRGVFDRIVGEKYVSNFGEPRNNYWPCGIMDRNGKRMYHSEDVGFFNLCHAAGIRPLADTKLLVNHIGSATFPTPEQKETLMG